MRPRWTALAPVCMLAKSMSQQTQTGLDQALTARRL